MQNIELIIERLDSMFPDRNVLSMTDVKNYTGMSMPTVKKRFGLSKGDRIDKVRLATILAEGGV